MFVSCECRVLSGRGLYFVLITRPEESNRARARVCVCLCDREASIRRKTWSTRVVATWKKLNATNTMIIGFHLAIVTDYEEITASSFCS